MALSTEDAARLAKLSAAYDALIAGQAVARVEFNGRVTAYTAGDTAALKAEVDALNSAAASTTGRRRGAVGFRFR